MASIETQPANPETATTRFVARQPIFDGLENVYGYELLFRCGLDNFFSAKDGDDASRDVLDNLFTAGAKTLTDEHLAFINCTRQFLVNDYATLLPKETTAIEVLETIEPDDEVLSALRRLKQAGYLIVLDDFVFADKFQPFIELADIIKVDFLGTSPADRSALISRFGRQGLEFLAEKVETREQFEEAEKAGYRYFQGYFFCRPQIVTRKRMPAFKLHYLKLLHAIAQKELDIPQLARIIEREVSLCYKLLRLVNSAAFGLSQPVKSIRHALVLLGEREVKKWASVVALLDAVQDKPHELALTSLVRARCCELLAPLAGCGRQSAELFLTGLFSLIDALLGRPMQEILAQIALPEEARGALSGADNQFGRVCELVTAYAKGDWQAVSRLAARLKLPESVLPSIYLDSLNWAKQVFGV